MTYDRKLDVVGDFKKTTWIIYGKIISQINYFNNNNNKGIIKYTYLSF